jgi:hypothetical protein
MPATETPTKPDVRSEQVLLSLTPTEKSDLVKRAGEEQVRTGTVTSIQDLMRAALWPNGLLAES